jgi:hypothetical protein
MVRIIFDEKNHAFVNRHQEVWYPIRVDGEPMGEWHASRSSAALGKIEASGAELVI